MRRSSPRQWLPMTTRSGGRKRGRASGTSTAVPTGGSRSGRAGDEAVGAAEGGDGAGTFGRGIGGEARRRSRQRDHQIFGAAALGVRAHGQRRRHRLVVSFGGRPAMARITGATNSWNVKIADVGKPGSTTTGLPSLTARQIGLPGLSATPWATMPGCSSRRHSLMRQIALALGRAAGEEDDVGASARANSRWQVRFSRPGRCPRGTGSPPSSVTRRRGWRRWCRRRGPGSRLAGCDELVAGRDDGDRGPPMHRRLSRTPSAGQHAGLARGHDATGAQHGLAAADIAASGRQGGTELVAGAEAGSSCGGRPLPVPPWPPPAATSAAARPCCAPARS